MGKKITQLATITEVADDDLIVGVDVSDTSGSDNGTNKKFTKATLLDGLAPLNPQLTGWNPDAETWVYHNVDDPTGYFKIEGKDVSANYSVGWRIMFTNGGNVIKGIITAITYSAPNTIITFLHEIDPTDNQALYLLQNSAITENYYSPHKAPLGFPMSPAKWSVVYKLAGTQYSYTFSSSGGWQEPTDGSSNTFGNIIVPIGVWEFDSEFIFIFSGDSTADDNFRIWGGILESAHTSPSGNDISFYEHITTQPSTNSPYNRLETVVHLSKAEPETLTSKITRVIKVYNDGDYGTVKIGSPSHTPDGGYFRWKCAYL